VSVWPEPLQDHVQREVTTVCHCWRLTRADATVIGFTDHDRPLAVDGTAFEPESGLNASEARDTLGLAIDTVDVEGALSSERISDADIAAGLYDGATVETLLVNWRNPTDFVLLRKATVGKITRSDQGFVAELESIVHALDRPNGRYVSRSCDAELGDARCKVNLEVPGRMSAGVVVSVEMPGAFLVSGLDGFGQDWFTHGVLSWTSGPLAGRTARVEAHRKDAAGVRLTLRPDGAVAAAAGDSFTLTAGCDKKFSTCKAKFANPLNFRGFPHLPGNDAAYAYVTDGDTFDGGPLVP
jgi:uncharacterized phage protein (TIGR02218 family)